MPSAGAVGSAMMNVQYARKSLKHVIGFQTVCLLTKIIGRGYINREGRYIDIPSTTNSVTTPFNPLQAHPKHQHNPRT
jgi:hypothetical protein